MDEKNKKAREIDRKVNRSLLRRTIFLMIVCGGVLFVPIGVQLYRIQVKQYDYWTDRAAANQTRDVSVSASRGTIYDSSGVTLAVSTTVYNLILSPHDIVSVMTEKAENDSDYQDAEGNVIESRLEKSIEETQDLIVDFLVSEMGLDEERLRTRIDRDYSYYEVLAYSLSEEEAQVVRDFTSEHSDISMSVMLYLEADTQRYYPYGSAASHLLGYMAENEYSDGEKVGVMGLESGYNEELSGSSGRIVTAKTGQGFQMLSSYDTYQDAEDGLDLTLTIDLGIQQLAEEMLQEGIETYEVQNGGFIIAMNPNTGAIYAMASSPDFDPNSYSQIIDSLLLSDLEEVEEESGKDSEEYSQALTESRNSQWRNKALSDTYEPGSTFKALVVAMALEEGVVSLDDTFYCGGSSYIGGYEIHCQNTQGHGEQTLTEAVENSCNVALMEIGQRIGAETMWQYFEDFGLFDKTGIDLAGEGNSLFWDKDYFTSANGLSSLAVASFGQTFKVTPIQMITAFASVINGGHLLQPYVVEKISDSEGNTTYYHETTEVRQVISESTSETLRGILESVVANGTGKNAYMAGYRIGGKTATSEKRDEDTDDVVVSFMGFAPADNPQVLVLVAFDSPTRSAPGSNYTNNGTYISGGNIAAPIAGELVAAILDEMGVEKQYTMSELDGTDTVVPSLVDYDEDTAEKTLSQKGFSCRTVGTGTTVTGQIPAAGSSIPGGSTVILYLGEEVPTSLVEVPDLSGMTPSRAKDTLESLGLFMRATGLTSDYDSSVFASSQSVEAGTMVARGTVIDVHYVSSVMDYAYND